MNFSLNPTARNFLPNVLSNNSYVYIESIYPELLKAIDADDEGYSVNSTLLDINSNNLQIIINNIKHQKHLGLFLN